MLQNGGTDQFPRSGTSHFIKMLEDDAFVASRSWLPALTAIANENDIGNRALCGTEEKKKTRGRNRLVLTILD